MTLNPGEWPGALAYGVVFLAALIEGEVVYVSAAVLVGRGALNPFAVVAAGMLGAAIGDQIPFYLLRFHVRSLLNRIPLLHRRGATLTRFLRRRQGLLPFVIRFAPGLRLAIAAACAYAEMSPVLFSTFNLLGAFVWAVSIVICVAWLGPTWLPRIGLRGWWAVVVPAAVVIGSAWLVSRVSARRSSEESANR
jgi:membrane protein DedA with SNARE-associated domain